MKMIPSDFTDKNVYDQHVIIHGADEEGREEVRIPHSSIAHILGRYAVEKFPELVKHGYVNIELTTDEYDHPLVIVTEATA